MHPDLGNLIQKYDTKNMLDLILRFSDQVQEAIQIGKSSNVAKPTASLKHILVAGMGGSAVTGDLLHDFMTASGTLPCTVVRDYKLPAWADETVLVVLSSYSGNTEETLSAHQAALSLGCPCIAFTSGGELYDRARRNGHPVIQIPGGQPPRTALGYLFFPVFEVFLNWGWIRPDLADFDELFGVLESILSENNPQQIENSPAMEIAEFCADRIPVIYSSPQLQTVAVRWKGQICENSKSLAYHNIIPEMNHNEIIGWQRAKDMTLNRKMAVMFLRDKDDHSRVKRRTEITKELIEESGTPTLQIHARGNSLLAKRFSLIYLVDFVSYHLAMINHEDPTTIKNINYLKSVLAREEN
jgi:glucose/mannose-6-phosphate isomerase